MTAAGRRSGWAGWFAAAGAAAGTLSSAGQSVPTSGPAASSAEVHASVEARRTSAVETWAAQQNAFHAALQRVSAVIVRIDTVGGAQPVEARGGPLEPPGAAPAFRQADGPTTGLIWSADGLIVTSAFNFLRDPTIITVTFADGRRLVARLIARDRVTRLALLQVDATGLPTPHWAERGDLRVGQWALAAGFGHGTSTPALSVGVLSGLDRMAGLALQTDAKISPAHYGGPLFDLDGRVLGMCVPMGMGDDEIAGVEWYDSGIGFAIAHDVLATRVPRLAAGETLERGLLGIQVDARTAVVGGDWPAEPARGRPDGPTSAPGSAPAGDAAAAAAADVVEGAPGVRIESEPDEPAAGAGLRAGEYVVSLNGAATPTRLALRRVLTRLAAGDRVQVVVADDDGAQRTVEVTLAAPSIPSPPAVEGVEPAEAAVPADAVEPAEVPGETPRPGETAPPADGPQPNDAPEGPPPASNAAPPEPARPD